MNAQQRRYSKRNKKRKLGKYLEVVKVIARLESFDLIDFYSDEELFNLFSRNITFTGYPQPPVYWYKKWERC